MKDTIETFQVFLAMCQEDEKQEATNAAFEDLLKAGVDPAIAKAELGKIDGGKYSSELVVPQSDPVPEPSTPPPEPVKEKPQDLPKPQVLEGEIVEDEGNEEELTEEELEIRNAVAALEKSLPDVKGQNMQFVMEEFARAYHLALRQDYKFKSTTDLITRRLREIFASVRTNESEFARMERYNAFCSRVELIRKELLEKVEEKLCKVEDETKRSPDDSAKDSGSSGIPGWVKKPADHAWKLLKDYWPRVLAVIAILAICYWLFGETVYEVRKWLTHYEVFGFIFQGSFCVLVAVLIGFVIDRSKDEYFKKVLAWPCFFVACFAIAFFGSAVWRYSVTTKPKPQNVVAITSEQAQPVLPVPQLLQREQSLQVPQDQGQSGGYTPFVPNPPLNQQQQPQVSPVYVPLVIPKPWPTISGMVCKDRELLFAIGHQQSPMGKVCYKIKAYKYAEEKKLDKELWNGKVEEYWAIVDWVAAQENVPNWKVIRENQRQILALWNCDIENDQQVVCRYPNPDDTIRVQGYADQAIRDLSYRP